MDKVKKEDSVRKKLKTFLKIFSIEIPNFFAYIFRELLPNISFWAMVRKRCMENILSKFYKLGPFFSLILPDKCSQISFWCRAEGWIKKINRYSSRANNRWTSEKHSTAPAGPDYLASAKIDFFLHLHLISPVACFCFIRIKYWLVINRTYIQS